MSEGLLDTSVVVAGIPAEDVDRLPHELAVSVMTLAELHAGVLLARDDKLRAARLARLADAQREFAIFDVDPVVAHAFGELRAQSGRRAVADLLIAATAIAHEMTLVTRDERQARLVPGALLLG
jgi:predicted nucleic acid-binding protein